MTDWSGLPGAALVDRGLADLRAGQLSCEALTLALAPTRLRGLGIELPDAPALPDDRELALYATLGGSGVDDPYYRYNSLRRELDSFLEALEARVRREVRTPRRTGP